MFRAFYNMIQFPLMDISELFRTHINHTKPQSKIVIREVFLRSISPYAHAHLKLHKYFLNKRSYVSSLSLKHVYDRRPNFIENNLNLLEEIMFDPDLILRNHDKRGDFIFVKRSDPKDNYFICCPVEICLRESGHPSIQCVTFFKTKSRAYIKKFSTVWDREGDLLLHRDTSST